MIQVGERERNTANSAYGQATDTMRTRFEIEAKDVGRTMDNYLGFRHSSHTIQRGDVGRVVEFINDTNPRPDWRGEFYESWYFLG